jgi:F-type H+-transporting ATPase subunit a
MLGKNLQLSQFVSDPNITTMNFLGLGPVGSIHVDSLLLSWVSMGAILLGAFMITRNLTASGAGGKGQAIAEMIYGALRDLCHAQIGHRYKPYVPLITAMFLFILVGNFVGVGPWLFMEHHVPGWPKLPDGEAFELASPTTDFNITVALALTALVVYIASGFWVHGASYTKHIAFNPIEWLDLIIRPSTLAIRLMVVITADELMRGAFIMMMPVLLPSGIMAFELFVGVIQAFVFALLTSIYIGLTVAEHH